MLPVHRRQLILADINHQGAATIAKLSEKFAVSEMTIRRDLKVLEDNGYVERTHGGAVRVLDMRVRDHLVAREMRQQLAIEERVSSLATLRSISPPTARPSFWKAALP
jgi:DeoR/GlpR family transcriptional regulator of sugar metabolism